MSFDSGDAIDRILDPETALRLLEERKKQQQADDAGEGAEAPPDGAQPAPADAQEAAEPEAEAAEPPPAPETMAE
ncbi:MAG: hypothetical protein ACE5R4_02925, partial [Armatimonadota bacterium]